MARRTADIFHEFEHIRERMEQAYQRLLGGPGSPAFGAPFMEPPVDVYETDNEVIVQMEIAGITREAVELELEADTLTVRGERKPLQGRPRRIYSQMEISHGRFQRDLHLPAQVDAENATAEYKDGILEIVLPKSAPTTGRHLRIVVN